MTPDLELRVLTGLHRGARCPAQDGALLGSHEQCDVVLWDEGIAETAGRLRVGEAGWRLCAHGDPTDTAPELPFGAPCPLGPIHLTVADAQSPWPLADELSAMLRSSDESVGDAGDPTPDSGWTAPIRASQVMGETSEKRESKDREASPAPRGRQRRSAAADEGLGPAATARAARARLGLRWAVGILLVLLVFGGAASYTPARVQPNAHTPAVPLADGDTLARTQQLLRRHGYAERLRASLSPGRQIVVAGWVRNGKDRDDLATILTEIWPLPSLRVDDQESATASILARSEDLDVRVAVEYPAPGRLTIRGVAASDTARTEALARWRTGPDASLHVSMSLSLVAQVSGALDKAVAAAGLPAVTTDWRDKILWVDAHGWREPQRQRLQGIVDALNPGYADVLRLREEAAPTAAIPFRIHSVVGGRQPWVMLEDGTRIVPGGTHGPYSLKSIEDGRVVFDGPSTAVIAR